MESISTTSSTRSPKLPERDAPAGVNRSGSPDGLRPYFGDVQDHTLHVLAEMDTYRDLLGAALDVQVFYSFTRLGHIMRRLTAVTVIIMIPNLVASIYGMNFDRLFPPSEWRYGFLAVVAFLGIMVAWGFIHSRILRWL
jgi:magnesium transporter